MRNEQFMLKDAARAQKLYEIVQKKQEELRLANKKFKALHNYMLASSTLAMQYVME